MPTSLNVVALISGGKDSLFSILHCLHHGHNVIALANLFPDSKHTNDSLGDGRVESDDIDSFMYQTAGHSLVPLYAEALGLPLYRGVITGRAINPDREYSISESHDIDETENLTALLKNVKEKHPGLNAVSSGAILSTYQRTRLESVAARVQLTSLAYLWQYPVLPPPKERHDSVTGLLDDMEAAGCDARLIKIASAGIRESLLWCRISDPLVVQKLIFDMLPFSDGGPLSARGAMLGEGGEYETITVSGPRSLWKKKIHIEAKNITTVPDGSDGTVRIGIGEAAAVDWQEGLEEQTKDAAEATRVGAAHKDLVRVPTCLDCRFDKLQNTVSKTTHWNTDAIFPLPCEMPELREMCKLIAAETTDAALSNMTDPELKPTISEQTAAILLELKKRLAAAQRHQHRTAIRVVFATILLRDMDYFAVVNEVYGKHFDQINPPSRITICCGDLMPPGALVRMSFIATSAKSSQIHGLHVQSISYWAPANIGPYSQAIGVETSSARGHRVKIAWVSGQIPLVPESMKVLAGDEVEKTVLSLQHLWRIGQCFGIDWWICGVAYLANCDLEDVQTRAILAWQVWKEAHIITEAENHDTESSIETRNTEDTDDDNIDLWDRQHNFQAGAGLICATSGKDRAYGSPLHMLPNPNVVAHKGRSPSRGTIPEPSVPPFLAAEVHSLPRSVSIEWHGQGLARLAERPLSNPCLNSVQKTTNQYWVTLYMLQRPPSDPQRQSLSGSASQEQSQDHDDFAGDDNSSNNEDDDDENLPDFFTLQIFRSWLSNPESTDKARLYDLQNKEDVRRIEKILSTALSSLVLGEGRNNISIWEHEAIELRNLVVHHITPPPPPPPLAHTFPHNSPPLRETRSQEHDHGSNSNLQPEINLTKSTLIPCQSLWGHQGRELAVAIRGELHFVQV